MPRKDDWSDLSDWMDSVDDMVVEEVKSTASHFMKLITVPTNRKQHSLGDTPVDTGRLMANHQLSINSPVNYSKVTTDMDGRNTYQGAVSNLSRLKPYQDVYIQNNLAYATIADSGEPTQWPETLPYQFWHLNTTYIQSIWQQGGV